ncbi:MAG: terminase gpA endonuclease subunit [Verrucomicrobiota bacterium]
MKNLASLIKDSLVSETQSSVVQFAESELYFNEQISPGWAGPYSTKLTPFVQEPLENFADRSLSQMTLCMAAQVCKSTIIQIGTLYVIRHRPTGIVWVWDTTSNACSFSRRVLKPLITLCGAMDQELPTNMRDLFLNLEMHFSRCTLNLVGSNSPGNLASRPAGLLNLDEVDKYPRETRGEAGAVDLAIERTTNVPGALVVMASSPTTEEGPIWQHFMAGDQRVFEMPSPHAPKKRFAFEFSRENLQWDPDARDDAGRWDLDRVKATAYYKCPFTGKKITDMHKPAMMRDAARLYHGGWVPKAKGSKGVRSYRLPKFYSPTQTFGSIAAYFLQSKDLFGLQNFKNSWEALPWTDRTNKVDDADVLKRRGNYPKGTIPIVPKVVILGADVGQSETYWSVSAFTETGEMLVIDWGKEIGPQQIPDVFQNRKYRCVDGTDWEINIGFIDAKYRKDETHQVCYRSNGKLWPTAGGASTASKGALNFGRLGQYPPPFGLLTYVDRDFKSELYIRRIKECRYPGFQLPQELDEELVTQLCNEELADMDMERRKGNKVKSHLRYDWKRTGANHLGDTLKEACIGYRYMVDFCGLEQLAPPADTVAAKED